MTVSLDMAQIFTNANSIVTFMLPIIYVAAGISLGFVLVGKIISAFRGG